MHFSTWLWDQLDTPGDTGKFAKVCWDDVNNGCGYSKFNAQHWLEHFESKHKDRRDILSLMLLRAYKEYMLFTAEK